MNTAEKAESRLHAVTLTETAARLSAEFAGRTAQHDADGSFVAENYENLRAAGLIEAGVPAELGGGGAETPELCEMLRQLAHGCGATALAFAMHTHLVAAPAWRWRNTPDVRPAVEPLLRRVATEKIVLATSGGSDWVGGSGKAEKVEGGYKITARKAFASGSPVASVFLSGAVLDEPDGPKVLHFAVPFNAPGLKVVDTWNTLGMRGTGSQDVSLDGVFVADDKVALKRRANEWHKISQIIATNAIPLIYSVYLGIAEAARDSAIDLAGKRSVGGRQRRLAGEIDTALTAARLAQAAMARRAGMNDPGEDSINEIMMCRRIVEEQGLRVVERALELAGGAGFYRTHGLEQRWRDMQGARYHPMNREAQYEYSGAMAFGQPVAQVY